MANIGFIGLGIMGKPMAKNLLKAGHSLVVYDIMPAGADEVAAAGAAKGSSPKDVAGQTELVITMELPTIRPSAFLLVKSTQTSWLPRDRSGESEVR